MRPIAAAAAARLPLAVSIRSTGRPMNSTVVTAMIAVIGPAAAPPICATITGMPRKTLFEKQAPMPVIARSSAGARQPSASTAARRTSVGPKKTATRRQSKPWTSAPSEAARNSAAGMAR